MPEGDTIFRTAAALRRALAGRTVTAFESPLAGLARASLAGRTVRSVDARGKWLVIAFDAGLVLLSHMRMHGSWHLYRPGERWQRPRHAMRAVLTTPEAVAVAFDVPVLELVDERDLVRHRALADLGPDLLSLAFDEREAARRLRASGDTPVAEALLDQRVMAGVGNVFKSEVLFVSRTSPFAQVSTLGDDTLVSLVRAARDLLRANVVDAQRSLAPRMPHRRTTGRTDPGAPLWVYGRAGRPCRVCGTPIACRASDHNARLTYWCPTCQAGPAG